MNMYHNSDKTGQGLSVSNHSTFPARLSSLKPAHECQGQSKIKPSQFYGNNVLWIVTCINQLVYTKAH